MKSHALLLILTFVGFISLGLPDAVNGIVWPSVTGTFGIPVSHLGFVLLFFSVGYLSSCISTGKILRFFGVGGLLSASCLCVILSLIGFSTAPSFGFYLASALVAGLGAGAIDTGLNAFASRTFSAKHMSWLHACWGIGATSGALVATAVLSSGQSWRLVPATIALILVPITVTFAYKRRLWNSDHPANASEAKELPEVKITEALTHPTVIFQALIFFVYVGVESITGSWAFTILTQDRAMGAGAAGTLVSCYWGSLTVGRFLLGHIVEKIGVRYLLLISISTALIGGLLFIFADNAVLSGISLLILGFSLAPIYPSMMSQTPLRLAHLSDITVGIQAGAALVGQVSLPSLAGYILKNHGFNAVYTFLAIAMVFLWFLIVSLFRKPLPNK